MSNRSRAVTLDSRKSVKNQKKVAQLLGVILPVPDDSTESP
ncbi:MAG: hypothetical protein ABI205_01015 [Gemmatimonadaceae bacterium]